MIAICFKYDEMLFKPGSLNIQGNLNGLATNILFKAHISGDCYVFFEKVFQEKKVEHVIGVSNLNNEHAMHKLNNEIF